VVLQIIWMVKFSTNDYQHLAASSAPTDARRRTISIAVSRRDARFSSPQGMIGPNQ
jgi:hypothetical protein